MANPISTACICIDPHMENADEVGAATRFASGTVLDHQVQALLQAGIVKIGILASGNVAHLEALLLPWQQRGVDIVLLIKPDEVVGWAKAAPLILVVGHNVVATQETYAFAAQSAVPTLFVRDAATSDDRHERIDLNDRWVGISAMPPRYFSDLRGLDEEWSLQSALLRHAAQNNVIRCTLEAGPVSPYQNEVLVHHEDLSRWEGRVLQQHFDAEILVANPFRRWISVPFAHLVVPMLWDTRADAGMLLSHSRYAILGIALLLAFLQLPLVALLVLAILVVVEEIVVHARHWDRFSAESAVANKVYLAIWAIVPLVLLLRSGGGIAFDNGLAGMLISLTIGISAACRAPEDKPLVTRDEAILLGILSVMVGQTLHTAALFVSIAVLTANFWRPIVLRLKAI